MRFRPLPNRTEDDAVKVTLDLTKLLNEGAITAAEHDRLAQMGRADTGTLLVNVLLGFGVVAVAAGCLLLMPNAVVGTGLGGMLMAAGLVLSTRGPAGWTVVASICILVAALLLGAGIVLLSQGVTAFGGSSKAVMPFYTACLLVAALFALCAIPARSGLLASLTVLVLFTALGSSSSYGHAYYELQVRQPFATVVAFSALALAAHAASRAVTWKWARLLTVVARTSLFLVNLGFWVGSLWGDDLDWLHGSKVGIPDVAFALAWAAGLVGVGVWAGRTDRRWVLNLVTVFAGIHFYTQWFEHLGATPATVLLAGLAMLGFAVFLWRVNQRPAVAAATA